MIEISNRNEEEYNSKYVDKKVEVLFEEKKNGIYHGHTKNYLLIYCNSEESLDNKIVEVQCKEAFIDHINGEIC